MFNWFDEQIRQRKISDQELFEDSIFQMASAVLGKQHLRALDNVPCLGAKEAAGMDVLLHFLDVRLGKRLQ